MAAAALKHIKESLNTCLKVVSQEEIVIPFQGQNGYLQSTTEDDITDSSVAKSLRIMDDAVDSSLF